MDLSDLLELPGYWATALVIAEFLIKILAIGTVPENRHPASSHTWLLLILLIPVIGIPLFLLIGSPHLRGRRHRIQSEATAFIDEATSTWKTLPDGVEVSPGLRSLLEMNRNLTGMPCTTGRNHGLYSDYSESLVAMTRAVAAAEKRIDVQFYAQSWDHETDDFFTELLLAAERGVEVRLLVDHMGSLKYRGFRVLRRRLRHSQVRWKLMLPLNPFAGRFRRPDLRNHRKMLIVDSEIGFLGSQNLIERYYGSKKNARKGCDWHDIMVEMTGDVVAAMQDVFVVDWYTESGEQQDDRYIVMPEGSAALRGGDEVNVFQLVPSGPGFWTEPNMRLFVHLVSLATRNIHIVSPYFVPNEALLETIKSASYRGIVVELFVPEKADQFLVNHSQRSYFRELLEAGVRIHRYREPRVLHSKLMLIDDEVGVFGSSNMDMRSFQLNFEVSVLTFGGDVVTGLRRVVEEYREDCDELSLQEWLGRPWAARYVDNVARLTSALQ